MSDRVQMLFGAKIRKVVQTYERGADLKSIASAVDVSAPTISKWLTEEGYRRKKSGRVPLAMKARVRDLHLRGWDSGRISRLLDITPKQVAEWSDPQRNPILGGEKDPLKVKGQRKAKLDRVRSRKRGRPKNDPPKKGKDWPPPRHKCRKHWSAVEESYVIQLMENGIAPGAIYRRMRASRSRQLKIWRKYGNEGPPPNFPEAPEGTGPVGGKLTPTQAKERRAVAQTAQDEAGARLQELESDALQRQQRIAELEASAVEEERKIRLLEVEQKKLLSDRKERAQRLSLARAALEKRGDDAPAGRRRVIPGSFEAEQLGLKPGDLVDPGRPGRPALAKPSHLGEYADNGRYFTVSKDWADLEDASPDELSLFANFLTTKKLPAKVEKKGDQPKAYFDSTWPKKIEAKWVKSVEDGLDLLDKYSARKKELSSKNMFSKRIAKYLAKGYDAYANANLTKAQKSSAREELEDDWARLKKIDRLILIFAMGVSDPSGAPTTKGIERGRAAKILLQKDADVAAKKLSEKQEAAKGRKALRQTEDDDVAAILAGGRKALGESDKD